MSPTRAATALDLSLVACAQEVRERRVSPVALAEEALERLTRAGPKLGCVVRVTADAALAQARAAEQELRRGRYRGLLHGLPYGLKDNIDTRDIPTTWGSRLYADRTPPRSAVVAERLQDAGGVLVAKLALTEFAMGVLDPHSSITGACRNPWDTKRWCGGSSSGPAAAVAARLVPFALGTDTLGSILGPAANCGVTGYRPTFGAVPRLGILPYAFTMDRAGPLCRSAVDCAAVLSVVAGRDRTDPSSTRKPARLSPFVPAMARGLRVGVLTLAMEGPGVKPFQAGLQVLTAAGLQLEVAPFPAMPYWEVAHLIVEAEGAVAFDDLIRSGHAPDLVDPAHHGKAWYWLTGRPSDYVRAQAIRSEMQRAWREIFRTVDVIATFNPALASSIDEPEAAAGPDPMNLVGCLLGLPAVSVPMGFDASTGLPFGLTITGRPLDDARVLATAALFQAKTDWHTHAPRAWLEAP